MLISELDGQCGADVLYDFSSLPTQEQANSIYSRASGYYDKRDDLKTSKLCIITLSWNQIRYRFGGTIKTKSVVDGTTSTLHNPKWEDVLYAIGFTRVAVWNNYNYERQPRYSNRMYILHYDTEDQLM